jgi:hypothetical protein
MKLSYRLAGLAVVAVAVLCAGSDPGLAKDGGPGAERAQRRHDPAWALVGADATQHREAPPATPSSSDSVLRAPRGPGEAVAGAASETSPDPSAAAAPVALTNPLRYSGPVLEAASGPRGQWRGPLVASGRYRLSVVRPQRPLTARPVERPCLAWVRVPCPPRSPPA